MACFLLGQKVRKWGYEEVVLCDTDLGERVKEVSVSGVIPILSSLILPDLMLQEALHYTEFIWPKPSKPAKIRGKEGPEKLEILRDK